MPVIVAGEGERPTLSAVYASISEVVRFRPSIALVLEEETFARALECGADEACVATELEAAGVELGFLVVINTELSPALLGVKVIDVKTKRAIASSVAQVARTQLLAELGPRVAVLLDQAGHPLAAKLVVKIDPPSSVVKIDGAPLGAAIGGAYFVAPGKHTVGAAHEDYLAQTFDVETRAGAESEVSMTLVREARLVESPYLWIGVAVAVAGAVTAVLLATRSTERYVCAPFENANCEP